MLISIQSNAHRDAAGDEPISLVTSGTMVLEDGRAVLRYDEILDESLPPQHVTVTVENDGMQMVREGEYTIQLGFRKGQRYEGQYQTPFGAMDLAVFCTRLRIDLDSDGGEILLNYQMDVNGQFAAVHDMEIRLMRQNG